MVKEHFLILLLILDKRLRGILTSQEDLQLSPSLLDEHNPFGSMTLGKSISFNPVTFVKEFSVNKYEEDEDDSSSDSSESSIEYFMETAEDIANTFSLENEGVFDNGKAKP